MRINHYALLALVAVLAVVAVGCGSSGKGGYSKQAEKAFVKGCVSTSGNESLCRCAFNKIKVTVPYRQFEDFSKALENKQTPDPIVAKKLTQAARSCALGH